MATGHRPSRPSGTPNAARDSAHNLPWQRIANLDPALGHDDPVVAVFAYNVHRQDARAGLLHDPRVTHSSDERADVVRRDGGVTADGHLPGGGEEPHVDVEACAAPEHERGF